MQPSYAAYLAIMLFMQQPDKPVKPVPLPDFSAFREATSEYTPLGKNIWLEKNSRGRRVLLRGAICRREAPLEEFACLKNTKEHESIVSVDITPKVLHAAILAAGAQPGSVARFDDDGFHAPTGDMLEITIEWKQGDKTQRAKAQDWIRDLKTKQSISHPFVFAGSQEVKHPITGEPYYLGNDGDLISVANFASSIVDLAVKSSATDAEHLFETFTERIPPQDTPVVVILKPVPRANEKPESAPESTPDRSRPR
jgi:hypothetical protein